jgi:hypothetical protein
MTSPKYKLNKSPRLSANQLAELVNATPIRRRSIIRDAKFPKTVTVAHYMHAREGIEKFLTNPARTKPDFHSDIQTLTDIANSPGSKEWKSTDANLSIEALQRVEAAYGNTGLGALDLRKLSIKAPKLVIEGVQVSIAPFATTHAKQSGKELVGCATLLLNKSEGSSKVRMHRCKSAAILSLMFTQKHLINLGLPKPKLCFVYDVFDGTVIAAPTNYKRALNNMSAQCEEVASRWDSIDPPADYDGPGA